MKNIFTLLAFGLIANLSMSQIVFQSDLSSWSGGNPTDFFGSKTSILAANVTEVTTGVTYGTSKANLINTGSGHKRLTTQPVTVVPGTTYTIKMWASTVAGDTTDIRVSMYDLTNASWTYYTPYQNLTGTALTMYIDSVVAPAGCTSLEFIISFRNSDALGFSLDSVSISGPNPPLSQIDLPVTFDDSTVDYTMTDFGGNASSLGADPADATTKSMCVIKTTGAQTWAGTTISTPSGLATAIPFSATDTLMTVRVWSPAAGKTIRLKVEDASNGAINCETDVVTTVAGAWDTLTFNFMNPAGAALNLANTYDMASLFFDFGTAGAQDTFYFDDVMLVVSPPAALSQIDLPVTFDDSTVDYTMTDFGGNASSLGADPADATTKSMCVIKTTGAQTWAGTTISTPSGLATAIPFSATDTLMTVRVWSPAAGKTIRLKVEDASNGAINCETDAVTTVAGAWDTLTFNFMNPAGAALNLANTYDMASLFFDFGTAGAQDTFYFDDVMLVVSPPAALSQIDLPVTFDDSTVDYTMTDFGGNASSLGADPADATTKSMCVIKTTGAQTWAGTTISTPSGLATAIPFSATDTLMTVRVWSPAAGKTIRLKVEDASNGAINCETDAVTTVAGAWDTLTFNFMNPAGAALNLANTYDMASLFFDFGTAGAQDTFYFDDVMLVVSPPAALSQIDLPVTFDDSTVDYTMTDFGGNASSLGADPADATTKSMCVIKTTGAQTWAGTTISTPSGLATAIPFSATDTLMTVRVWSPAAGKTIRLKVEDASNGAINCETDVVTTVAGAWDTLTFNFMNPAGAALNLANTYDMASLFFDFGTAGAQDTFYFDDVMLVVSPPAALSQIDLPVTFDDSTVDYTMTDFGGNASSLGADPADATTKSMCVIKTTGAQTWAGTTISTPSGLATAIPFSATDTLMTVRVWSPAAGKTIRLKVEDASNGAINCETDVVTTVAGAWDTLTFNFMNPAGAALNLANTYDMASLFFDFGTAGAQDTFYFDDVMLVVDTTTTPPTLSQIDVPVTFEDTTVDYTMTSFGGNSDTLVIDPTDPTNHVVCAIKTTGAATWAGTTIGTPSGFATNLPFSATATEMNVRVWSPTVGLPIRLKVEDAADPTHTCETEATTYAVGWNTLNFDFSNEAAGTAQLSTGLTAGWIYNKASIFFDFGTAGAQDTFYFDDVNWGGAPVILAQIDVPVTFEDSTVDYTMTSFGGNSDTLSIDPTDPTNKVMCVVKPTGAQTWSGTTIGTASGFATALPFTATDTKMTVRVWSSAAGKTIRLKVEDATSSSITCETDQLTTMNGGWDTLTFDFGTPVTGTPALNFSNTYDKASIFFDFGTAGAQDTFYFDDVYFGGIPVVLSQIDLPVTFEDSTVDYTMTSFGGNTDSLAVDPTDPSNKVMCVVKTTGAQTWAGTTVGTAAGFANAIPFSANDTLMSVKVWSASAGTPIRLKVEDASNGSISCETEALTVTAGGWDTLTFNFMDPAAGTPALNLANTYDKASLFFDFGTAGAQDTFYFDNLMLGGDTTSPPPPPPSKLQIDLTVTFEDTAVDYTMTDFGGNASSLIVDPTDATNHVMEVTKTSGAQTWAGTTIGTSTGFATLLPFSSTDHIMSVRVWSPDSNTVIRLKVEDANDVTHTCETESSTTVNGGWEILNFDFSNEAAGTAQLSTGLTAGWVYNKASIFFDFGNAGAGKVYYFDDVRWGPAYTGNVELDLDKLTIYPNPTDLVWNVSSEGNEILTVQVFDIKGNLILTSNPNSTVTQIDASTLPAGMYVLRATTESGVITKRLIKN